MTSQVLCRLQFVVCLVLIPGLDLAAVDFNTDVLPVLTKAGCNSGACHGAAIGRGGFRLSLYGQSPISDYESIVYELDGRRVDFVDPDRSLLLRKPGGLVDHEGGQRIDLSGPDGGILRQWIAEGCRESRGPDLIRLVVEPSSLVVSRDRPIDLVVTACLDDGTTRDVTSTSSILPQDGHAVDVHPERGQLVVRRPGRHIVVVRHRDLVSAIELIVPYAQVRASASGARPIDGYIVRRLNQLGIEARPEADSFTLVRRMYLDLVGRIPTPEEVDRYLAIDARDRRGWLVETLTESDDFVRYWTYWMFASLRAIPAGQGRGGDLEALATYHRWLDDQIREHGRLDEICRALVTAAGDSHTHGATGFYRSVVDARSQAELFAETMLGSRLRCANCHDHPLDRWTQDDYHGLAAVFAGIDHGKVVRWVPGRVVIHPGTKAPAQCKLPGDRLAASLEGDPRGELVDWLCDAENPYFARNWANRIWAALMGRGLVHPMDDVRETNPPSHPELLDWLAARLVAERFRFQSLIREIVLSDAYARAASDTGDSDREGRWYASREPRVLAAAVLMDAINDAIGGSPSGQRTIQQFHSSGIAEADAAGACQNTFCDPTIGTAPSLAEALALINGRALNQKISDPRSYLHRMIAAEQSDVEIMTQLFRRALARRPTADEQAYWQSELSGHAVAAERIAILEDMTWSLLTCREFTTNH